MKGGRLIREARRRAALTQRELAERMGTTQSAIARWESLDSEPGFETVHEVIRACGLDLQVALVEYDDSDIGVALSYGKHRTVRSRLRNLAGMQRFAVEARQSKANRGA